MRGRLKKYAAHKERFFRDTKGSTVNDLGGGGGGKFKIRIFSPYQIQ